MDIKKIEIELKKRLEFPYTWSGIVQNDVYDNLTSFIYHISNFDEVQRTIKEKYGRRERFKTLSDYALNRWFNFWSAYAIESIFCSMPGVIPAKNHKDRLVDFEIQGIRFDHKTTVFPKKYSASVEEAQNNPDPLLEWLYVNQSQQKRKHYNNRLFIVLFSSQGDHWKLKTEITWLKDLIETYVSNFDPEKLHRVTIGKSDPVLSDIIWGVK